MIGRKNEKNPIFAKRLIQLQSMLDNESAFLTVNAADIFYLTGCTGSNNHLLVTMNDVYLFTDGRYITQIETQSHVNLVIEEIGLEYPFSEALKKILHEQHIYCLKFTPDHMSYLTGKAMISALPKHAQAIQDLSLFNLRARKDEMEIEIIRHNMLITTASFLYIQSVLKEGITECELANELDYYCRKQGASNMAFPTIVASGVRSSLPHGIATDKVIQNGEIVQLDFGIVKDKYVSDFSRCLKVGEIDPALLEIRDIVETALKKVKEEARCGMTGSEIDSIAREYINSKEFGEYFVHGLGHAVGLEVHENPRLNGTSDIPITENMVLTIEPGIYLPGVGGVRLEDVAVMRADGFEILTSCGYDF
ncbi:MAG: M24 family metallopeptidase [Brevinemataceae bacterium]